MTRVGIVTLGCEKNTVDSERYLAQLVEQGAEPVDDLSLADVILVNTCGFIDAAKKESIDAIVNAGKHKGTGVCRTVVAVGCLVERHRAELAAELPEVDMFVGASEMHRLVPALREVGALDSEPRPHPGERLYSGDLPHLRYLKVSEGCDHGCAFCAIPLMRGRHRSFALADVVREAQLLELQGAREVNLVAQDLAHYGRDARDGIVLPDLLSALLSETSIPWLRLLYLYSAGITPRLLETMAREERVLPYLDMPIQHASDTVLARMRRPERRETIRGKVRLAREIVPHLAIRTTCIVGFPGETDHDFEQLLEFLEETRFDGVGCFTYSAQDGTRAWKLEDDVPDWLKRERLERVTELQRNLANERNYQVIGRRFAALVDAREEGGAFGRIWLQAHDVDGITWFDSEVEPGTLVDAEIIGVENDYDLRARVVSVRSAPTTGGRVPRRGRSLPTLSSAGAYGR